MNLVFIGSGNVAFHLSRAFSAAGHRIVQVWSRNIAHALELAEPLGAVAVSSLADIDTAADGYVIAVPDDYIASVSSALPATDGLVLHTSGSTPLSAISQPKAGVIWFPHSFVKSVPMDYGSFCCCFEASSPEVEDAVKGLLCGVAKTTFRLDSNQRRWAHLVSVMTNNFGHALNALAEQISVRHGIDFAMLQPLIMATACNASRPGLASRQTGPAARGDSKTIASHRDMLAPYPEALCVYDAMTALIQSSQKSVGNR